MKIGIRNPEFGIWYSFSNHGNYLVFVSEYLFSYSSTPNFDGYILIMKDMLFLLLWISNVFAIITMPNAVQNPFKCKFVVHNCLGSLAFIMLSLCSYYVFGINLSYKNLKAEVRRFSDYISFSMRCNLYKKSNKQFFVAY